MYDNVLLGVGIVLLIVTIIYILWAKRETSKACDELNKSYKELTESWEKLLHHLNALEKLYKSKK